MFQRNQDVSDRLQVSLDDIVEMLDGLPPEQRVPLALEAASRLVETSAFGLAQMSADFSVSRLILLAADLERMGQGLTPRGPDFVRAGESA